MVACATPDASAKLETVISDNTAVVVQTGLPTLAVLVGIFINNSRLTDLRAHVDNRMADLRAYMDTRFAALEAMWRAELHRVEEVVDARLKHLEERG